MTNEIESETPRTDAEVRCGETMFGAEFVLANFSRRLERELNKVLAELDCIRELINLQADDLALWPETQGYIQEALRKLNGSSK